MPEKQDQNLIKLVTSRQSKLENDKSNFNDRMQDVADYVCPHRDDIRGTLRPGEKKGNKIFDGTAVSAAVLAADGIHGYHVSPAFPWFKYMMNRKEVNKVPEIKAWLQEIEFNMYMALNRSNFYAEMWGYIYDGFTIGTAPIYPEEDLVEGRIIFEAVHPGEAFIAENRYGEVDILHRKRKLSARKIVQMFGVENCPDPVKQAYENHPFQEFEVIHAVFPRKEYDDRRLDGKNKKYASVWLLKAGNHLLRESGVSRFPYNVWRYLKTGKDVYGTSPAHLAMSDIKGVNIIDKCDLGARQLANDPPLNVPSYMEGKVQWKPRGVNCYREGTQDRIEAAITRTNFPAVDSAIERKQRAIKERFHVDTFLMLAQLEGRGQRTAYEVSEMMAEKAAVLGAELGPLNTELDGILDRVYDIELAAGRMPQPPDVLLEMADRDPHLRFDPVYMGPLAQSQRERFAKDGIRKFFVDITPIVQVDQTVLDNFDLDAIGLHIADSSGLPSEGIRSAEKRDAIRQGRQQAAAMEAQKNDMERLASGAKDLAAADQNGMVSQMMGAMNAA